MCTILAEEDDCVVSVIDVDFIKNAKVLMVISFGKADAFFHQRV
jgi:hypothetical protein